MQPGDAGFVERVRERREGLFRRAVRHVVETLPGRDPVAHPVGAPDLRHRPGDLDGQAQTVLDRPAIGVGARVGAVADELVEQVAVAAMDLDGVEPSLQRVARALAELVDDARDLVGLQRARRLERFHPLEGHRLAGRRDGGRRDGQRAARLERGMGDPPDMPELERDPPARPVNRVGHQPPARDLLGRVDTRRQRIADALLADLRRLGDDQRRRRALGVILGVERARCVAGAGPVPRHGRHRDPVRQVERAQPERPRERLGHRRRPDS